MPKSESEESQRIFVSQKGIYIEAYAFSTSAHEPDYNHLQHLQHPLDIIRRNSSNFLIWSSTSVTFVSILYENYRCSSFDGKKLSRLSDYMEWYTDKNDVRNVTAKGQKRCANRFKLMVDIGQTEWLSDWNRTFSSFWPWNVKFNSCHTSLVNTHIRKKTCAKSCAILVSVFRYF